jgi:hypothetical protein
LRSFLSSFKIQRSFSTIWPGLCEFFVFKSSLQFGDFFCGVGANKFSWVLAYLCREQNVVDFKQVDACVHQFKGSSAWYFQVLSFTSYLIASSLSM